MRKNHEFVDGIEFIDKLNEGSDSLEQYKKQHSYSITNQYNGG